MLVLLALEHGWMYLVHVFFAGSRIDQYAYIWCYGDIEQPKYSTQVDLRD